MFLVIFYAFSKPISSSLRVFTEGDDVRIAVIDIPWELVFGNDDLQITMNFVEGMEQTELHRGRYFLLLILHQCLDWGIHNQEWHWVHTDIVERFE